MDAISWIAEQRILEAAAEGAFDDLPGRGRPLVLEDDSHLPPDLRLAWKVLRNAGYVPDESGSHESGSDEAAQPRQVESLLELLAGCPDEREKLRRLRRLDVFLARIGQRRGRAVSLPGNAYHAKVSERFKP